MILSGRSSCSGFTRHEDDDDFDERLGETSLTTVIHFGSNVFNSLSLRGYISSQRCISSASSTYFASPPALEWISDPYLPLATHQRCHGLLAIPVGLALTIVALACTQ